MMDDSRAQRMQIVRQTTADAQSPRQQARGRADDKARDLFARAQAGLPMEPDPIRSFPGALEGCPKCHGGGMIRYPAFRPTSRRILTHPDTKEQIAVDWPEMAECLCACVERPRVQAPEVCGLVGRLTRMRLADVDAGRLDAKMWHAVQSWVQGLPETAGDGSVEGMMITGPVGTGKTGLMVGVLDAARLACVQPLFVREVDIVRAVRATYDGEGSETRVIERFEKAPLLGIDDVGKAYVPQKQNGQDGLQWLTSILYTIIDERLIRGRPTLITTNLDDAVLLRRLGDALMDRIDTYWRVEFAGDSRR